MKSNFSKSSEKRSKTGIEALGEFVKGRSAAVIGIGVSNAPLISLLHYLGASKISARDKKDIMY